MNILSDELKICIQTHKNLKKSIEAIYKKVNNGKYVSDEEKQILSELIDLKEANTTLICKIRTTVALESIANLLKE